MIMNETGKTTTPRFLTQWSGDNRPSWALLTTKPTKTIPDQSMTIQEIIARFTRTGMVPRDYLRPDPGGQLASDPDFDPLDQNPSDVARELAAAKSQAEAAAGQRVAGPSTGANEQGAHGATDKPATTGAGEN